MIIAKLMTDTTVYETLQYCLKIHAEHLLYETPLSSSILI